MIGRCNGATVTMTRDEFVELLEMVGRSNLDVADNMARETNLTPAERHYVLTGER